LIDDRFARLKQVFTAIVARVPEATPQVSELQNEISRLLASEKEHMLRAERLQAQYEDAQKKCEDFQYKWSIAKAQLAKAQSKASQYMEMQNRRQSASEPTESVSKQTNGDVANGVAKIEVNGIANEEAESAKRAALAEVEKRKQQVEELEAENKKLNEQLTSSSSRLNNLSEEDYAQTQLFKALRSQHEDVIKRVNDLEAKNVQLREEAQKLQAERTAYRNNVEEECRIKCDEAEASIAKVDLDIQRIRSERDVIHQQKAILEGNQTKHDVALKELQNLSSANEAHLEALSSEIKRLKIALKEAEPESASADDIADQSEDGMKNQIVSLRSQLSALNMELESMQTAVQKFKATATKKVQDFVAMEQEVQRLKEAKHRLDSNRFSEKTILDAKKAECENMRRQSSKSGEIIAQFKESENKAKEFCANLEKQLAEYRVQAESLTDQNGVLSRKVEILTNASTTHETQAAAWKAALAAKDADLAAALHAQRDAEAEAASLKSKLSDAKKKVDDWKNKTRSDPTEEMAMLKVSHSRNKYTRVRSLTFY
jgi:E3 ubiquitin-protein ligase BRE1